jgi:hypothetical protein
MTERWSKSVLLIPDQHRAGYGAIACWHQGADTGDDGDDMFLAGLT